jgi:hypothetical protein
MHNTDKMKKTDLQEIVRQAIQEVINEETYAGLASIDDMKKDRKFNTLNPDAKIAAEDELKKKGVVTLEEDELDEDNQPVKFELAPDVNAADFTRKKAGIIAAMQAVGGPITKPSLAKEMGYTMINPKGKVVGKQNPINADFMALVADGVIVQAGEQTAPRFSRPQPPAPEVGDEEGDEEGPSGYENPEGGVAGDMSDEKVDAGFPNARASDEEEPEENELEKTNVAAGGMSDADYESFMKYTDLEDRLSRVKSDILKAKRSRPSMGDISDQPSNELQNLRDLKIRLQAKLDDLLADSEYLQKRREKMTGKKYEPITTPEEDEEEQMNEWAKNRMQYYAGIKK